MVQAPIQTSSPKRALHRLVIAHSAVALIGFLILRLVLWSQFAPRGREGIETVQIFLRGLSADILPALLVSFPLIVYLRMRPARFARPGWEKKLLRLFLLLFWALFTFGLFTEYYFFEEFKSRFNTVAVDYLLYPHEVFVNIWDAYPVGRVAAVCLVSGALASAALGSLIPPGEFPRPARWFTRFWSGILLLSAAGLAASGAVSMTHFSTERVFNELANNGQITFFHAFFTRHLDYAAFYRTLPRPEAYRRSQRLLGIPEQAEPELQRRIPGRADWKRLNVVIFLEESFGSEYWGCLGRKDTLTPEMDELAADTSLLFTNIYASGNRTVRGFEGVLSSFPPLPGDSIVKRDRSENVETIARVLKRHEYNSVFLYGGRGVFDGMRSFALNNGYDRFVEQKHIENPSFTTIWGVADEDLFKRAIVEFRALNDRNEPFLGTVLSVSNHKPYTYPPGRIPEDPTKRSREYAVKYSDWALGQFFQAARQERFWTNTLFVVVADHGSRVYGSQSIPIHSYEIPLLMTGPAVIKERGIIPRLGCSLDVAPTILALLGCPYDTLFFGEDLLSRTPGRVLLNHNRDIGMFRNDRLVVLGINKTVEYYRGDPKIVDMRRITAPDEEDIELEKDAEALFQVADELYIHEKFRVAPAR